MNITHQVRDAQAESGAKRPAPAATKIDPLAAFAGRARLAAALWARGETDLHTAGCGKARSILAWNSRYPDESAPHLLLVAEPGSSATDSI